MRFNLEDYITTDEVLDSLRLLGLLDPLRFSLTPGENKDTFYNYNTVEIIPEDKFLKVSKEEKGVKGIKIADVGNVHGKFGIITLKKTYLDSMSFGARLLYPKEERLPLIISGGIEMPREFIQKWKCVEDVLHENVAVI